MLVILLTIAATVAAKQLDPIPSASFLAELDSPESRGKVNFNKIQHEVDMEMKKIMSEAVEKAKHNPLVLDAQKKLRAADAAFKSDSSKATEILASIKQKMDQSQHFIDEQSLDAETDAKLIREFTEKQNKKLEENERKLMDLQQHKITSSFLEFKRLSEKSAAKASSLLQVQPDPLAAKANEQIEDAERKLSSLSRNIRDRVSRLTTMLHSPDHEFPDSHFA